MFKDSQNIQETEEPSNQIKLNDILYNCNECSSPIEILSIDEKECLIEFKCIKNNKHNKKISINKYIEDMKKYNNKNINNDRCEAHNNKYNNEIYCFDCDRHLCKECLKSRNHFNHQKNNIIEIQPNQDEINIIKKIIKVYDDKIDYLERQNLIKASEINKNENNKIIGNMKNIKRLIEIIYNTYNIYKNNYYNSLNINKIIKNFENKINIGDEVKNEYEKIKEIIHFKKEKEKLKQENETLLQKFNKIINEKNDELK
jgi:hypothetical protein